jgi:hypothetical protein
MNMKLTLKELKEIYAEFETPWGEVNIFGIRDEDNQGKDLFNDIIGIATDETIKLYTGTTDPGAWWTRNPVTAAGVTGAAHLCEGFHREAWRVGIHSSKTPFAHEALVQTGNSVKVWRDVNKDFVRQGNEPVQSGYFGINIHRAGIDDPKYIGKYSAGCQVIQDHKQFLEFMAIVKATENYKRNRASARFSYFIINKNSL